MLAYAWGPGADLAFRRGWTHGVLALLLWPFALTGAMLLLGRLLRREPDGRQLLLLSTISVLTHPVLDTLNTYGVRWLMPFSGRWFYGDTLFIVDPWLWLALGMGVLLSRRRTRPARLALGLAAGYAASMALSGMAARVVARGELQRNGGGPVRALMLAPMPVTPLIRTVVADRGDYFEVARFRWLARPRIDPGSLRSFPRGGSDQPAAAAVAATTVGRRFLSWARFPVFRVERDGNGRAVVHIVDLRYADRPGVSFGAVSIPVDVEAGAAR